VFRFAADGFPVDILKSLQRVSIGMFYYYVFLVIATDTNWINVLFHFIGIVQVVPVHFTLHARALILDCVFKILLYNKFFSPLTAVFCFCRLELGLYFRANQCFCF